jgi:hypothetical protein
MIPGRPYDPLYGETSPVWQTCTRGSTEPTHNCCLPLALAPAADAVYTVSGARDHYRAQTVAGGFALDKAPDYPNMFSVLPHFPASGYRCRRPVTRWGSWGCQGMRSLHAVDQLLRFMCTCLPACTGSRTRTKCLAL